MIPLFSAVLFGGWFLMTVFLFNTLHQKRDNRRLIRIQLSDIVDLQRYETEASIAGWIVTGKEFAVIVWLAVAVCAIAALLTKNLFILIAGFVASVYLPSFLIEKKRQSNRMQLVGKLTDPFRILLSRIPDQQNITRALEKTRDEVNDETIRRLLDGYFQDMAISGSVRDALMNMKKKINIKKCDLFFENLILAHYEGFTAEACKALDKAIEALEFDIRAIEKVKEQNRIKKRKLYLTVGIVWSFPGILSFVNTTGSNIYLNTLPGRLLILLYFLGSIFVYVKGEQYLSLNLDEL